MMIFPGLVTWVVLVLSVLGPFFLPTTMMIFATLYVVWSGLTLLPIAFSLVGAVRKVLAARDPAASRPPVSPAGPPYHTFIIPNYKEDPEILGEVLRKLASHTGSREKYIVVLAMEAREEGSGDKAEALEAAWRDSFRSISHSSHPGGVPGECAGKASNAAAAGHHLVDNVMPQLAAGGVRIEEVMVTVLDADILLGEDYIERHRHGVLWRS